MQLSVIRSLSRILGNISQKERVIVDREVKWVRNQMHHAHKETKSSKTMGKLKLKWYSYRKKRDFAWECPEQKKVYQNPHMIMSPTSQML